MFSKLKEWWKKRSRRKRAEKNLKEFGNCCYCSSCGDPLNDQASCVIEDTLVYYTCTCCGQVSVFDFGLAPCPILISPH